MYDMSTNTSTSNTVRNSQLAMLDLIATREFRDGRSMVVCIARKAELIAAFDLLCDWDDIRLGRVAAEYTAALELDRTLIGTAHYQGVAHFWDYADRHTYRPMSRQDRIAAHHNLFGITQ